MAKDETIQEYYAMSKKWLSAALTNLEQGLYEPAMFNGIHALELGLKAALHTIIEGPIKTHNVGGLFGKHFRDKVGDECCRAVNLILARYNLPRYPDQKMVEPKEVAEELKFIKEFIENIILDLIEEENVNNIHT